MTWQIETHWQLTSAMRADFHKKESARNNQCALRRSKRSSSNFSSVDRESQKQRLEASAQQYMREGLDFWKAHEKALGNSCLS
jgi:hypothetical protein